MIIVLDFKTSFYFEKSNLLKNIFKICFYFLNVVFTSLKKVFNQKVFIFNILNCQIRLQITNLFVKYYSEIPDM